MELSKLAGALEHPKYLSPVSAWVEHIPFAFALIDMLRPRTLVELGTHMGDSYCAFCQEIKRLGLEGNTRTTAIDTWVGDTHAGGYSQSILDVLRTYHDPLYKSFSRLLQSTFDDAAGQFQDRSIDLLHIDGLHTYDAVKHDFETWLPKVSERGVVLFHDTQVKKGDFGVYRLWEEVAAKYPSFEFAHGYGLGVLAVGEHVPEAMLAFLKFARENPKLVRGYFEALGNRIQLARGLGRLITIEVKEETALKKQAPDFEIKLEIEPGAINIIESTGQDLKWWIDAQCGAAESRGHAFRVSMQKLQDRLGLLLGKGSRATAAVYISEGGRGVKPETMKSQEILTDGETREIRIRIEMPAGGPGRWLRVDPGDRTACWIISNMRLELAGGKKVPLGSRHVKAGPGVRILQSFDDLDTRAGGDYVLFCHTQDPQLKVSVGKLLPRGAAAFDLVMECSVLDCFRAYNGQSVNGQEERVGHLIGTTLNPESAMKRALRWPAARNKERAKG